MLFQEILRNYRLFLKIYVNIQALNVIPENSRENCVNLDSRSCLEARDLKKEILILVSKHEIERKKFFS